MSTTKISPRYAHTPGQTRLAYTPDGKSLITVGSDQLIRKFTIGSDDEPLSIEQHEDAITGIATSKDHFATCSEDATVNLFSLHDDDNISVRENTVLLTRCTLPIRDVAFSPDGAWVAVASDETVVKIINTSDMLRVIQLRNQSRSIKHVTFHPAGTVVCASCTDGIIYIYSLSTDEPTLLKKLDGVIPRVEPESDISCKALWHPDGRAFAYIVVISRGDWERQRVFKSGHNGDITDIAWSPNGAYLASAATDGKVVIWQCRGQTIVTTLNYRDIICLAWHPSQNVISFTSNQGHLYTIPQVLQPNHTPLPYGRAVHPCPLLEDQEDVTLLEPRDSPMQVDDVHVPDMELGNVSDSWIEDDDGAGYIPDLSTRKRHATDFDAPQFKRRAYGSVQANIHESFQPGSTPWRGSRRYLALNLTGVVWSVDQETHNTITVEFFDTGTHRGYHFTDHFKYDKACLDTYGAVYSSPAIGESGAIIHYRPNETWTEKQDWQVVLPRGEEITSLALSHTNIAACTSKGYARVYTLSGVPVRIYRQKHVPVVVCAAWKNYIMVVGNGPQKADGTTELIYNIEDVSADITCQSNDIVAIPSGGELKSLFFSENGDPMIYDSDGILLVLWRWRTPGYAKWVPLLDTNSMARRINKEESYWPVAVAQEKFHCIILKGGDKYPYFPRPLFSEFDLCVPTSERSDNPSSAIALEEGFVRNYTLYSLGEDALQSRARSIELTDMDVVKKEVAIDKILLQLINLATREDRAARALDLTTLLRKERSVDLAIKIAERNDKTLLAERMVEYRDGLREPDIEEL
ncbi:Minichromosome loss protein 1 [Neolecta irregularis DAH-3]|uniref:Minichromosome loss protein 1 n=1 Tax=Neolecta irregularis (strain DAH-3) TaxID=1198029 RepID=A0A1U7LMX4_NEOID|nr:Minichromosome loss protein 1 [Neolecta irregularis DAH-3]|eukprot:OLL24004.1 Minichromosome loss protein 1 [Neolecta irregularis DAH-3]